MRCRADKGVRSNEGKREVVVMSEGKLVGK